MLRSTLSRAAYAAAVGAALSLATPAKAAIVYSQGFETDTTDWSAGTTRVPSGTGGIPSESGSFHATVGTDFTRWGGYSSVFPTGGYTTSVGIYLNLAGGALNDTRFDFTSAINNAAGNHLRDFAFNGGFYNDGPDATGSGSRFVFSASNNTGRANSFPKNPGRDPFSITTSGWYDFQHTFYDNGGFLAVDLSIIDHSTANVLHTWTLTTTDAMSNVGGNRYGWFPNNEFGTLAIDNASLTIADAPPVPEPATLMVFGTLGLTALGYRVRRKARA